MALMRSNAIGYATHRSRAHDAVIRVYDQAGNVIETHEQTDKFKEAVKSLGFSRLAPSPVASMLILCLVDLEE
jgi:hypothetical protein